jgi:hypothetical protein
VPLEHAQLIIALDYSRWFSLQRLLRRTITRLFDHREICNGNRESLRGFFSRDAIIVWHFKSLNASGDVSVNGATIQPRRRSFGSRPRVKPRSG